MTAYEIISSLAKVYTVDTDQYKLIELVAEAKRYLAKSDWLFIPDNEPKQMSFDFERNANEN